MIVSGLIAFSHIGPAFVFLEKYLVVFRGFLYKSDSNELKTQLNHAAFILGHFPGFFGRNLDRFTIS